MKYQLKKYLLYQQSIDESHKTYLTKVGVVSNVYFEFAFLYQMFFFNRVETNAIYVA